MGHETQPEALRKDDPGGHWQTVVSEHAAGRSSGSGHEKLFGTIAEEELVAATGLATASESKQSASPGFRSVGTLPTKPQPKRVNWLSAGSSEVYGGIDWPKKGLLWRVRTRRLPNGATLDR